MTNPNENTTNENDIDLVPVDDTQAPAENDTGAENNENSDTPARTGLRDSLKNYVGILHETLAGKFDDRASQTRYNNAVKRAQKAAMAEDLAASAGAIAASKLEQERVARETDQQAKTIAQNISSARKLSQAQKKQQDFEHSQAVNQIHAQANEQIRLENAQVAAQEKLLKAHAAQARKLAKAQQRHAQSQALLTGVATAAGAVAGANIVSNQQAQAREEIEQANEAAQEANEAAQQANENAENSQAVAQEAATEANEARHQAKQARQETEAVEENIPEVAAVAAAGAAANETTRGGNRLGDWRRNARRNSIEARAQNPRRPIFENVKFVKPDIKGYFSNLKTNAKSDWEGMKNIFSIKNSSLPGKGNLSLKQDFLDDINNIKNFFSRIGKFTMETFHLTKNSAKSDTNKLINGTKKIGEKITNGTKTTFSEIENDAKTIGNTTLIIPKIILKGADEMAQDAVNLVSRPFRGPKSV